MPDVGAQKLPEWGSRKWGVRGLKGGLGLCAQIPRLGGRVGSPGAPGLLLLMLGIYSTEQAYVLVLGGDMPGHE